MGLDVMILVFWILSFKPAFSLSSFTYIKRLFSSSSLSAIRVVVSPACLGLLIFLLEILILACASSNPEFLMMYSAYHMLIDHVLSKKISFNKSKIEIISSIFSNHSGIRLEITRKKLQRHKNVEAKHSSAKQWVTEEKKIPGDKWKWKPSNWKSMGHSKSSSKKEFIAI